MARFIVNTGRDDTEGDDTLLSLREAVALANADPGTDRILFAEGIDLIRLTRGIEIEITDDLLILSGTGVTITGDAENDDTTRVGTDVTDLDETDEEALDDNTRLFNVTAAVETTFRNLVLTGGRTVEDGASGGALRSAGELTLEQMTISGNATTGIGAVGGGLFSGGGATLTGVTISGNSTGGLAARGGGFYANGTADLTNATISGNATSGTGALGGGLFAKGAADLTNVTISGNATSGSNASGGGLAALDSVTLVDSIVLGNSATAGADEIRLPSDRTATFEGANIVGVDEAGYNATVSAYVTNAPLLQVFDAVADGAGVLADNGGPTQTILIRAGGAAQDTGTGSTQTTDQRGAARPADGGRDIGAVELGDEGLVVTTEADGITPGDGLTLREAISFANINEGADTITFADGVDFIRLTQGQIEITDALTIDGGAGGVTITGDAGGDDVVVDGITDVAASLDGEDRLDDNSRIFHVIADDADTRLVGLTLTGGRTTAGSQDGGAVRSEADLTFERGTVAGNSTSGDFARGGGLQGDGAVRVTDSTVAGNSTSGYIASGGGITGYYAVTVTNNTISGNSTSGDSSKGGGLFGFRSVTVTNATFTGNSAKDDGGAIYGEAFDSETTLIDSILLGNSSAEGGAEFATAEDRPPLVLKGFNIVGADATAFDASISDNVVNAAPSAVFAQVADGVGVLADNGGPTQTVLILAVGPAQGTARRGRPGYRPARRGAPRRRRARHRRGGAARPASAGRRSGDPPVPIELYPHRDAPGE